MRFKKVTLCINHTLLKMKGAAVPLGSVAELHELTKGTTVYFRTPHGIYIGGHYEKPPIFLHKPNFNKGYHDFYS